MQQRAGVVSLKGGVGEEGDEYERHADRVADAVVEGRSASDILDEMAGDAHDVSTTPAVQRDPKKDHVDQIVPGAKITIWVFDGNDFVGGTVAPLLDEIHDDMFRATKVNGKWAWDKEMPELRLLKIDQKGKRSGGPSVEQWVKRQGFGNRADTILVQFDIPAAYRDTDDPETGVSLSWEEPTTDKPTTGGTAGGEASRRHGKGTQPDSDAVDSSRGGSSREADKDGGDDDRDRDGGGRGGRGRSGGTGTSGRTTGEEGGQAGNTSDRGSARGRRGGLGGEPSWVDNPEAEMGKDGARVPEAGGKDGGMAGGERGSEHEDGVPGATAWWPMIGVSSSVAPAVAVAMLILDADILGAGSKLMIAARSIRSATKLAKEVEENVEELVKRGLKDIEAKPEFAAKTAAEQAEILAAARPDLEAYTREKLAKFLDDQIAQWDEMVKNAKALNLDEHQVWNATENLGDATRLREALGEVRPRGTTDDVVSGAKTRGKPTDQLTDKGRSNPSPLAADELAHVQAFSTSRDRYLKKWREWPTKGYSDETTQLVWGRHDVAIENHMTPDDLSAVIRESRGEVITKADGTQWDHLTEYADARRSVINAIDKIKTRLAAVEKAGKIAEANVLREKLGDISNVLDEYEAAIP